MDLLDSVSFNSYTKFKPENQSILLHVLLIIYSFQVSFGRQWFVHCIYTVRSKENAGRGIGKRSIRENPFSQSGWSSISNSDLDIGHNGLGTNMNRILLDYSGRRKDRDAGLKPNQQLHPVPVSDSSTFLVVLGIVGSLLIIAITVLLISRRKSDSQPPSHAPTIVSSSSGQTRIITKRHYCISDDHTEV